MMTKLRESTAIIMWIVILAFVGLIVVEWGADYSGTSGNAGADTVGVINGEEISLRTFQQAMQNAARQKQDDAPRDSGTMVREVWDAMLGEILLRQEVERLGIQLSDQEVAFFARTAPPAVVQSLPTHWVQTALVPPAFAFATALAMVSISLPAEPMVNRLE